MKSVQYDIGPSVRRIREPKQVLQLSYISCISGRAPRCLNQPGLFSKIAALDSMFFGPKILKAFVFHGCFKVIVNGVHKKNYVEVPINEGSPKMVGLYVVYNGKILLKWMIWGYPHVNFANLHIAVR